jgi:hypothetical protein
MLFDLLAPRIFDKTVTSSKVLNQNKVLTTKTAIIGTIYADVFQSVTVFSEEAGNIN